MKVLSILALLIVLAFTGLACDDANASADDGGDATAQSGATTETFSIEGMTCVNCAADIQDILADMEGVSEGSVDFGARQATISYDPDHVERQAIIDAIADEGYTLELDD